MCTEVQRGEKKRKLGEVVPFWPSLIFTVGSVALSGAVAYKQVQSRIPGNREAGFVVYTLRSARRLLGNLNTFLLIPELI